MVAAQNRTWVFSRGRQQDLSVEEERRAAEDRRSSENRRGDTDRRRGNRRCEFRLDGDEPCKALAVMRDPTTKEWRCMEHLEVSPETP